MPVPGVDQVSERPLEELVQKASQQVVVLAREQVDVARRELAARVSQARPGVAMVGGGAALAALASGTGTAAVILLLTRRPGASGAALGVTGAYAGAGVFLTRAGLARLRETAAPLPDEPVQDEPVQGAKNRLESVTRQIKPAATAGEGALAAAKAPQRAKAAAKAPQRAKAAAKASQRAKT